jgi:hypothetical protein
MSSARAHPQCPERASASVIGSRNRRNGSRARSLLRVLAIGGEQPRAGLRPAGPRGWAEAAGRVEAGATGLCRGTAESDGSPGCRAVVCRRAAENGRIGLVGGSADSKQPCHGTERPSCPPSSRSDVAFCRGAARALGRRGPERRSAAERHGPRGTSLRAAGPRGTDSARTAPRHGLAGTASAARRPAGTAPPQRPRAHGPGGTSTLGTSAPLPAAFRH